MVKKIQTLVVLVCFACNLGLPSVSFAASNTFLDLPVPGTMLSTSQAFTPALIKGVQLNPQNPLEFNFIVDTGDSRINGEQLKTESAKMVKYFLASLTVPDKELWVNLSPYEKDRIIQESFGMTEMGRDLLAQDYILKQLAASLIYPEKGLGKSFWEKAYKLAQEKMGTTNIPVNTFNKVWIIPQNATVYEHNGSAFVVNSHLKVMLEEDYLALQKNLNNQKFGTAGMPTKDTQAINSVASQVVRDVLIPAIETEVNTGKNFANLRQVYHSMILAIWYKQNLKEALLNQVYSNQNKTKGIDVQDKASKEKIYRQYLEAFKKGVYNYIKEDRDPATNTIIPRKYFSGGAVAPDHVAVKTDLAMLGNDERAALPKDSAQLVTVNLVENATSEALRPDAAMLTMKAGNAQELLQHISGVVTVTPKGVKVLDEARLEKEMVYYLVDEARFGANEDIKKSAQRLLREIGIATGRKEASIHDFYMARMRGEWNNMTVPAINVRTGPTFDTMKDIFITAERKKVGLVIFELAASEVRYTGQDTDEYTAMVYGAAIATGYKGLLFMQADHYQTSVADYFSGSTPEEQAAAKTKAIQKVKGNILKAVLAGKLNIDVDPSTLMLARELEEVLAFERMVTTRYIEHRIVVDITFAKEVESLGGLKEKPEDESDGIWSIRRKLTDDLEIGLEIPTYKSSLSAQEIEYLQKFGITEQERKEIGRLYEAAHAETRKVTKIYIEYIRELEKQLGLKTTISIGVEERHIDNPQHAKYPSTVLGSMTLMHDVIEWSKEKGYVQPSKLALQTGTMHGLGGVVDWGIFERHQLAFQNIGVAVFVQHGTSTLSPDNFAEMPKAGSGEAHLATEYQKYTFEEIGKLDPQLRAKMRAFIEALIHPEVAEADLDLVIVEKLKAEKLWDPAKREKDYKAKFLKRYQDAMEGLKAKGWSEDDIFAGMLGDTLPKPYTGKVKDLIKELAAPFKREIAELPQAVYDAIHVRMQEEFTRIYNAQNVENTRGLIERIIPYHSVEVVLPPRPGALTAAVANAAMLAPFVPVHAFGSFAPALLRHGLDVQHVEVAVLKSQNGATAEEVLKDSDVGDVLGGSIGQALGSIYLAGQGLEAKVAADANAVRMGHQALIDAVNRSNGKIAFVSIASEGIRDGSVGTPLGRVYWSKYEGAYRNSLDRADYEAQITMLRQGRVKIFYLLDDGLENTNALKADEPDAWSAMAFHVDGGQLPFRHMLDEEKLRRLSVIAHAPQSVGLTALDSPRQALKKLAVANGIADLDSPQGRAFASKIKMAVMGARKAEDTKESSSQRHSFYIDEITALAKEYGVQSTFFGDGDLMPALVSASGIQLDEEGTTMVKFGRSGLVEGEIEDLGVMEIEGAQAGSRIVSNKKTKDRVDPKTAVEVEGGLLDGLVNQYGYSGLTFTTERMPGNLNGEALIAMTAVTGADPKRYGQAFANQFQRISFDDASNTVTLNTFLVTRKGVFAVRTTLASQDLKATRASIVKASPEAAAYVAAHPLPVDAAMTGVTEGKKVTAFFNRESTYFSFTITDPLVRLSGSNVIDLRSPHQVQTVVSFDPEKNETTVRVFGTGQQEQKQEFPGRDKLDKAIAEFRSAHPDVPIDTAQVSEKVDRASVAQKDLGGINLDPAMLNLQIKRDGKGIPLPISQQPIGNMKIDGFMPVIIKVTPIDNLPLLLGLTAQEPALALSH